MPPKHSSKPDIYERDRWLVTINGQNNSAQWVLIVRCQPRWNKSSQKQRQKTIYYRFFFLLGCIEFCFNKNNKTKNCTVKKTIINRISIKAYWRSPGVNRYIYIYLYSVIFHGCFLSSWPFSRCIILCGGGATSSVKGTRLHGSTPNWYSGRPNLGRLYIITTLSLTY